MGYYTGYEPSCSYCGKKLSKNESSGEYECLACTFKRMDSEAVIDETGTSKSSQAGNAKNSEEMTYAEYLNIQRFQESLKSIKSDLLVTKAIIVLNVLLYLYLSFLSENFLHTDSDVLMHAGANSGAAVFSGEWKRIILSMFLHGGLVHLLINMFGVWSVGNLVEKLFGPLAFAVIYFISGTVGSMFSLFSHSADSIGVGASGALCGVFGALLAYALFKKMPRRITKNILYNALFIIALSVVMAMQIPQIDNSAHIGGLVGGFVAAVFIGQDISKVNERKRNIISLAAAVACGALIFFSWDLVGDINKKNVSVQHVLDEAIRRYDRLEYVKEASYSKLEDSYSKGRIDRIEVLKIIDEDYIKFFKREGKALEEALNKDYVRVDFKKYTSKYTELYNLYWQLIRKYVETSNINVFHEANHLKKKIHSMRPDDFK